MNWAFALLIVGGFLLTYLILRFQRFWHMLTLLNADRLEVMKRVQDSTLGEYLESRYKEKEELLRFQILKLLRDRIQNEEDREEKELVSTFVELLENQDNEWRAVEHIRVVGNYYRMITFGRWRKIWGEAETKTMIEIEIVHDFKNGRLRKQYGVWGLTNGILKEIENLQFCRRNLFSA